MTNHTERAQNLMNVIKSCREQDEEYLLKYITQELEIVYLSGQVDEQLESIAQRNRIGYGI
tara:strand:+ start:367 stop:549 length:183 start_codon:yes stop_codon:yes gene_type:complete